jgi:hypothetical protein
VKGVVGKLKRDNVGRLTGEKGNEKIVKRQNGIKLVEIEKKQKK